MNSVAFPSYLNYLSIKMLLVKLWFTFTSCLLEDVKDYFYSYSVMNRLKNMLRNPSKTI